MPNEQGVVRPALPYLTVSPVGRATSHLSPPPLISPPAESFRWTGAYVGKTASEEGRQADARPSHCLVLLCVPRTLSACGCTTLQLQCVTLMQRHWLLDRLPSTESRAFIPACPTHHPPGHPGPPLRSLFDDNNRLFSHLALTPSAPHTSLSTLRVEPYHLSRRSCPATTLPYLTVLCLCLAACSYLYSSSACVQPQQRHST